MTELSKDSFDLLLEEIRQIVRQEIKAAQNCNVIATMENDALLTVDEAAVLMNVTPRWLYRHAAKLPFVRRINRKNLRFSEGALRRWIAAKKPSLGR